MSSLSGSTTLPQSNAMATQQPSRQEQPHTGAGDQEDDAQQGSSSFPPRRRSSVRFMLDQAQLRDLEEDLSLDDPDSTSSNKQHQQQQQQQKEPEQGADEEDETPRRGSSCGRIIGIPPRALPPLPFIEIPAREGDEDQGTNYDDQQYHHQQAPKKNEYDPRKPTQELIEKRKRDAQQQQDKKAQALEKEADLDERQVIQQRITFYFGKGTRSSAGNADCAARSA